MLKVVLFLLFIQQGCSSPLWKHGGFAEPGELSMEETWELNNKEGQRTDQLLSTRVRTRQRVADEQINSRRLVFENVGRFGTATLTGNMEAPTRKPKQMPRTTQKPQTKNSSDATVVVTLVMLGLLLLLIAAIRLYLKRNPMLVAWFWRRNKKGYMPLRVRIKNRKKQQHLRKGNKNRDSVPGLSGFHSSNESSRLDLNRLEDGTRKQSSKGTEWTQRQNTNKSGIKDHGNEQCEVESHVLPDGGKKLLTSNGDRDVERNVQRESTHAMQGKDKAGSRTLSLIHAGIRTSDTDTDVSDIEEYHKPGSAVWNSSVHLANRFKKSLSGLVINGKPERFREIASLPIPDTESEEDVDEIVLLEKDSKQNLISGSNGELELVEPEVLIKQIYVKKDSLPTNSSDLISVWKQETNSKQGDIDELASISADTGIDCDGSVDANLNRPLQTASMDSNNTLMDAAIPTTSFQISKENSEHSSSAEHQKECKIGVPVHAHDCDQQFHDKERGTKDSLQERSIEDACARNGVNNVASTDKLENECGNKKNALNEADVYDEVPKDEENDDSDVESDTSSIEISDIDSGDDGSLWEVSSFGSLDSFSTIKLLMSPRTVPSPCASLDSLNDINNPTKSISCHLLRNSDECEEPQNVVESEKRGNEQPCNHSDVYDEVPKDEENDDSDVESDTSSIEISDIDSDDEGSLWEVSSFGSLDSFSTIKLLMSPRTVPSPCASLDSLNDINDPTNSISCHSLSNSGECDVPQDLEESDKGGHEQLRNQSDLDSACSHQSTVMVEHESEVSIANSGTEEPKKTKKRKCKFLRRIFGKSMCVRGMD
eukprot:gene14154-15632_t